MMSSSGHEIKASKEFITTIIKCLSDAVGDDIKADIESHKLRTQNSTPARIWDHLNTNICKRFDQRDVIASPTKRGAWELVPVFERSTGIIYSLMREQRFELLKKCISKRRNAHYIDALVRTLNKDLIAPQRQLFLLPNETDSFCNEEKIQEIVQKIFSDLNVPGKLVERHALILFQSFNNELFSIRCCIVDSNLDIVEQCDWSGSIKASEGAVVDKVVDNNSTYNDPSSGLQFKPKAKEKMRQKALVREKDNKTKPHELK